MRRRRLRRQRTMLSGILLFFVLLAVAAFAHCGQTSDRGAPMLPDPASQTESAQMAELPEGWEWRQTTDVDLSKGTLALVNRDYGFDPSLPQTVSVYEHKSDCYLVKDVSLSVREDAMAALNAWMEAFSAESGKTDVNIVAGWRSYDDQVFLYQNAVETKGQAHADAYLALPGHSEHHTGLAVDLDTYDVINGTSGGFDGGGDYLWAVEHAWEYGFIQRYPPQKSALTGISYESWHFRYVGLPHAYVMKTENLCLEEYIDYLRNYPFFGEHLHVTCLGQSYKLYFCPKGQLVVPTAGRCTVSGNNVDGFIVTVSE